MKVFVERYGDAIVGMARAEGDGVIGDARFEIGPGESLFGVAYDELCDAAPCIVQVDRARRGRIVGSE